MSTTFQGFPKIARLSREVVITEKIDGTNAQVFIEDLSGGNFRDLLEDKTIYGVDQWDPPGICIIHEGVPYAVSAGSRTRWITPSDDNYGFAAWTYEHADELVDGLGVGRHFGEWWGSGVNRGYGLTNGEKRFSLFNVGRWKDNRLGVDYDWQWHNDERTQVPYCCSVVPIIRTGIFTVGHENDLVNEALDSLNWGTSYASPGFKNPEGIIIYHTAAGVYFKKTIEKDNEYKGKSNAKKEEAKN